MISRDFTDSLTWEEKARRNPLWAVMSVDGFPRRPTRIPPHGAPSSWRSSSRRAAPAVRGLPPPLAGAGADRAADPARVVEYGSGMGRILRAVHAAGYRCGGVDISETMLAHSRRVSRGERSASPPARRRHSNARRFRRLRVLLRGAPAHLADFGGPPRGAGDVPDPSSPADSCGSSSSRARCRSGPSHGPAPTRSTRRSAAWCSVGSGCRSAGLSRAGCLAFPPGAGVPAHQLGRCPAAAADHAEPAAEPWRAAARTGARDPVAEWNSGAE